MIRQRHRIQHVFPVFLGAEEQLEGLREDQRMLVPLDVINKAKETINDPIRDLVSVLGQDFLI